MFLSHPGFECGAGSLAMGFWRSMSVSSTSSNALHLLLRGPYNESRLELLSFWDMLEVGP
ncbi:hypothetical protein CDL12_09918 [Handroanthus impetiginosus]|uniref:Uncharacterized protein n=1 Tax=Handroanthus impetiginosus TaxID=429701 RepID=A0A2G9HIS1_9LAMI|nr:hypothetical protein CDL12_09918 [Handroanthus impetiginosus]